MMDKSLRISYHFYPEFEDEFKFLSNLDLIHYVKKNVKKIINKKYKNEVIICI